MLNATNPTNSENFDGVTAPNLPAGWTSTNSGDGTGWTTSTTTPASAPNAAFAGNPPNAGLSDLESPVWNVNSSTARLDFKINYNTEFSFDGAVLEIKIGSGAYQDILAAGGSFTAGGYNRTLFGGGGNPLGERAAWSGNSGGYVSSSVNLPAAASGQTVQFRWRMVSDNFDGGVGVRLDDVQLFGASVCAVVPPVIVTKTADTNDGACDTGDCSLREALDAADSDNLTNTIIFNIPANSQGCNGANCTITLTSPLAPAADAGKLTTINGAVGANTITLNGGGTTQILRVGSAVRLSVNDLNFTGGRNNLGGAIYVFGGGNLTLSNSALYNNTGENGGAIHIANSSTLNMTNVTVSGNFATLGTDFGNFGAGIYNNGSVTATSCTISNNFAARVGGGVVSFNPSTFTIRNTIIAGNTANNSSPDATAAFTSQGYNLVGNASGANGFNQTGDQTGTVAAPLDARLAPLGNYGGKTLTHALLDGGAIPSPAINTGTATGAFSTDQRGASRVGNVDKGSFEVNNTPNGGSFVAQLPDGIGGYNQTIAIESGAFAYTLASGMLPNGFSLLTGAARFSEAAGEKPLSADFAPTAGRVSIQGTPTRSATFPFTIALNNGTNQATINYSIFVPFGPTAASVSVAGRVIVGNRGLLNATVTLTDQNGNTRTARTTSFGYYRFDEVAAGQTYIVSVRSKRFQFAPQVISVTEDLSELNFYSDGGGLQ